MTSTAEPVRARLASIAAEIDYAKLPAEVVQETKRLILDTLGCALGGYRGGPCAGMRAVAAELGGNAEATIIGQRQPTSCTLAALVNGTLLRYLDANDYYFGRDPAHASGNLATALAAAERGHLSGRDLILGLVVGYEIQLRLCDFAGRPNLWDRGWHHATNMQFASAALAARLLGLDREGIANAMAIAGTHNNTLTESMRGDMATIKASIEATTAKAGIEAALMAKHGFTGPTAIFEGTFGWTNVVAGELEVENLVRAPAGSYRIMDTCMKPYIGHALSQGQIQSAIDVTRRYPIDIARITKIEAFYPEQVLRLPSMDKAKLDPRNRETADHSPPYLIAVGMLDGACGPAQFTADKLASPQIRRLMQCVELKPDPRMNHLWPAAMSGAVKVTADDGNTYEAACTYPPGHPRNRLSDADVERKFLSYARDVINEPQARAIIAAVRELDHADDLSALTAALAFDPQIPARRA
jgi:2-methylcitrate dehydratase